MNGNPNNYSLPSPEHVTKIAISNAESTAHMMPRNAQPVTSVSRIPVYTYHNNNNISNHNTVSYSSADVVVAEKQYSIKLSYLVTFITKQTTFL